mmetsp:Transcript_6525/g.11049  ORF Transcript_6525/g.11049 Transcript_6525/m.11049 type:complete len:94 (+) Transcript_6525:187-468(+)
MILALVALQIVNQLRLQIGIKSNKVEKSQFCPGLSYFFLSILTLFGMVFFMILQTLTLAVEVVVAGLVILIGLYEFIWLFVMFVSFKSLENSQ